MTYITRYHSPIGSISLASDGTSLIGLWFDGQKYDRGTLRAAPIFDDTIPVLLHTKEWLDRYFSGERPHPAELPLSPSGSDFRHLVWKELLKIPYGEVTTYGAIAKSVAVSLGRPHMSGQAIGGAVGHNPISIIIPCHRIVGTNGSLTGYAGGLQKKIQLLELEGVRVLDGKVSISRTGFYSI